MKQRMFTFDMSKCVACGACSVACMDQNDIDPAEEVPFRHIHRLERESGGHVHFMELSMACMHCTDAPCVAACPTGCLRKDEKTGLTVYDNSVCIGCHSCLMACPFEAPSFTAAGKMVKCDGCIERQRHGLLPACVRVCPFDALKMVDAETPEDNNWERTMARLDEPEQ